MDKFSLLFLALTLGGCASVNTYADSAKGIYELKGNQSHCWAAINDPKKPRQCNFADADRAADSCVDSLTKATGAVHDRSLSEQRLISCMAEHGWEPMVDIEMNYR